MIINYFYCIIRGDLTVKINEEEINKINVIDIIKKTDFNSTEWEELDKEEAEKIFMIFSDNSQDEIKEYKINLAENDKISKDILRESIKKHEKLEEIKKSFNMKQTLKFKVYLMLNESKTYFDIIIKKTEKIKSPFVFFIRDGITITDAGREQGSKLGNRSLFSFLIAEDEKISGFLSSAETPAHNNWSEKTGDFKQKYKEGIVLLRLIKNSIGSIINVLDEPNTDIKTFWEDMFYVSNHRENAASENKGKDIKEIIAGKISKIDEASLTLSIKKNNGEEVDVKVNDKTSYKVKITKEDIFFSDLREGMSVEIIFLLIDDIKMASHIYVTDSYSKKYNIAKANGGISISGNGKTNETIIIKAAYDVIQGNPFKKYREWDFNFSTLSNEKIECKGCEICEKDKNEIKIKIISDKFEFRITNFFDTNRDVVVILSELR